MPGSDFELINKTPPVFSPDSKRLAYLAKDGDSSLIVLDGKAGERFKGIAGMIFSADSKHFAYIAKSGPRMVVIRDEREVYSDTSFIKDSFAIRSTGNPPRPCLARRAGHFSSD